MSKEKIIIQLTNIIKLMLVFMGARLCVGIPSIISLLTRAAALTDSVRTTASALIGLVFISFLFLICWQKSRQISMHLVRNLERIEGKRRSVSAIWIGIVSIGLWFIIDSLLRLILIFVFVFALSETDSFEFERVMRAVLQFAIGSVIVFAANFIGSIRYK